MECEKVHRRISRYVDGEIGEKEKWYVEHHIKNCARCVAEKRAMESMSELYREVPAIEPSPFGEQRFWKLVEKARKPAINERLQSLLVRWNFVPLYRAAAAALILGLLVGFASGAALYTKKIDQDRLSNPVVGYFALDRMASVPHGSITNVYNALKLQGEGETL